MQGSLETFSCRHELPQLTVPISHVVPGIVAGLLVQNSLKYLLGFGQVTRYLGYSSLQVRRKERWAQESLSANLLRSSLLSLLYGTLTAPTPILAQNRACLHAWMKAAQVVLRKRPGMSMTPRHMQAPSCKHDTKQQTP